jgi:hypothetical protein
MTITLSELRQQSRRRADQENSQFVSDAELNQYINNSIAELHDILCEAYGSEYYVQSVESSIVANQDDYDLPSDFYELKGVDLRVNNDAWLTIRRFMFNERNRDSDFNVWDFAGVSNVRYRIVGNKLKFSPMPDRNATYRLWYVPVATKLEADTDTLDDMNAYSEYVIVDAAIKMMQKEESDVSILMAQKQALEKRIRDKSQNRDAGQAQIISDISAENDDYFWRRGN